MTHGLPERRSGAKYNARSHVLKTGYSEESRILGVFDIRLFFVNHGWDVPLGRVRQPDCIVNRGGKPTMPPDEYIYRRQLVTLHRVRFDRVMASVPYARPSLPWVAFSIAPDMLQSTPLAVVSRNLLHKLAVYKCQTH